MARFYNISPPEWNVFCGNSGNRSAFTVLGEYVIQFEPKDPDDKLPWKLYLPHADRPSGGYPADADAEDAAYLHLKAQLAKHIFPVDVLSEGAQAITSERERQIEVEQWTTRKDDTYLNGELVKAAAGYLLFNFVTGAAFRKLWPWDFAWFKPGTRKRELEKAGALIAAEWDRIDRWDRGQGTGDREAYEDVRH